jgi:acyl-CoA thioester hydrolase
MGYAVVVKVPVQWGDLDALGHVNNARFFTWFESARIAYFTKLDMAPGEVGPILASTSCDFKRAIHYPSDIEVGARVVKVGRTSVTMEYAVWLADRPDELCAVGVGIVVLVRYANMEKVEVPPSARAQIEAMEKKAT